MNNISNDPLDTKEDVMITIHLSNGNFEINEELVPLIQRTALSFGISTVDDLNTVTEEDFFRTFTPLMNAHYGLK